MGAVAMLLAFVLRLDFDGFLLNWPVLLGAATLFGVMVSTAGFLLGLNRGIWRYASLPDLVAIAGATSVAIALFIVAEFLLIRLNAIPRSSVVIAWAFTVVLLAGPRAAYRVYRNHHDSKRRRKAE
ncbi:polysaccharide biosynthesis protein, partial [Mesorhizobium sp. M7A.F.Ca.CA.004.05.1.1]